MAKLSFGSEGMGEGRCLACSMTHLVSNSMIEMESSSGSSALVTVVPKCFVMDTVRMDFDSIAGN